MPLPGGSPFSVTLWRSLPQSRRRTIIGRKQIWTIRYFSNYTVGLRFSWTLCDTIRYWIWLYCCCAHKILLKIKLLFCFLDFDWLRGRLEHPYPLQLRPWIQPMVKTGKYNWIVLWRLQLKINLLLQRFSCSNSDT